MPEYGRNVDVDEVNKQIISDAEYIPPSDGICGGVALTGFIDIEKIIYLKGCKKTKTIFLEKKFPFSILLLSLEPDFRDDKKDN